MTQSDELGRRRGGRYLNRRSFFGVAGAAAVAGSAGMVARRGRTSEGSSISLYPLDEAAGPPAGVRLGVQRTVWSVRTDEPLVAFSFDDGPDEELTPQVLDILDRYGVKATFFVMGYSVSRRPDIVAGIVARGHEIGNHTWTHVDLTRQTPAEARWQVALCQQAVRAAVDISPVYFRPPRGLFSGTVARYAAESGSDVVLWSVGRGVKGVGTPGAITNHVVESLERGDILGMHDGVGRESLRRDLDGPGPVRRRRDVEIQALPAIIEGTLAKGLRPTTVSALLAAATTAGA